MSWVVYIIFMPLRIVLRIVSIILYPILSLVGMRARTMSVRVLWLSRFP